MDKGGEQDHESGAWTEGGAGDSGGQVSLPEYQLGYIQGMREHSVSVPPAACPSYDRCIWTAPVLHTFMFENHGFSLFSLSLKAGPTLTSNQGHCIITMFLSRITFNFSLLK